MKISIVTPSIRLEMLKTVANCLRRQTFISDEFEWIVVTPPNTIPLSTDDPNMPLKAGINNFYCLTEPPKREGDYYNLNKAWNEAFRHTQGEIIVSIVDGLWFEPNLLERLWSHYETNPKAIIGAIGHQYDQILNGKPEHMVWKDPRCRTDMGSFYETLSTEIEWCVSSFPRKAIFEVGGMDEVYDKGAALSEKEANLRMEKMGYKLYLDQSIEYRAIHHARLSSEWDDKYKIACEMYSLHVKEVLDGKRLKLDYLSEK